jgi:hypothetical protein
VNRMPKIITARLVLPIHRAGDTFGAYADPTNGGEATRKPDWYTLGLLANELLSADAAKVRRVAEAIDGRGIEVAGDEDEIGLTGPADVLQPLIDAGDLEPLHDDGDEFED